MLKTSRLYSFLDMKNGFALHFLDGQKLIHDLALIHNLAGQGFAYFRDMVLSGLPMISFLKPGESLGLYIDSEEPYFRLKIETSFSGHTRTLLLPEDFNQFPMKLTGKARIAKQFPGGRPPYTSVVEFEDTLGKEVINQVLITSYQANSEIFVSEAADQSFLLIKLPPVNVDSQIKDETPTLQEYLKSHKAFFHDIFDEHYDDVEHVVKAFEKSELSYLSSRQVELFCPCSKERMVDNMRMIYAQDPESLFNGDTHLEAKCDYCKKLYSISRDDMKSPFPGGPLN